MRVRRKPYARPELAACPFNINEPELLKGRWKSAFKNTEAPIYMELGIGRGVFISQMAKNHPEINFIGIDIKSEILVVAKRNIESVLETDKPENVLIMSKDIERLAEAFSDEDKISRIYINFCNPWPKNKHKKHRLTFPKQLKIYESIMKPGSELYFKTDDDELYTDTLNYFEEAGWDVIFNCNDLADFSLWENIETEHEKMFKKEGKSIKAITARPVK